MKWQPALTKRRTCPCTFTLVTICCLPPRLYLTLLPFHSFARLADEIILPRIFNNQCAVNPSSYLFPWLPERQRTELWEMQFFFFFTGLTLLVLVVSLILHLISFLFIKTSQKHIDRVTSFTKVTRHRHTISKQRKKEAERYTTKNHETRR